MGLPSSTSKTPPSTPTVDASDRKFYQQASDRSGDKSIVENFDAALKQQREERERAAYAAADAGSLGVTSGSGGGSAFGPVEAKVRSQPEYSDPWAAADAGSLGFHDVSGRGDPDGTYTGSIRGSFEVDPGDGSEEGQIDAGRRVVAQAIDHTGSGQQIQQDEFEIIELENGQYIVNLPGVIDLSKPHIGLDPYNRSVRDVDQHATPSSRSSDVDDNAYAQMVREYVLENVPQGADVMLVGHSYGGDTVLDLASDPTFNNAETGVNVTHAVAAAYYSQPQLDGIQNDTEVLVLQNNQDVVVNVESRSPLLPASDKPFRVPLPFLPDQGPFDVPISRVSEPDDNIVVSQFNGGAGKDVGHHPDRYSHHVETEDNAAVQSYMASVADAGYATNGTAIAIDVSVPHDPVVAQAEGSGPPTGTTTTMPAPEPAPTPPPTTTTTPEASGPPTGTTTTTMPEPAPTPSPTTTTTSG
jgi:hypothetical protein